MYINLFILFGIWKNCLNSGRSQSLRLFKRKVIKQILVIIKVFDCYQLHKNLIQHSFVKVDSICR